MVGRFDAVLLIFFLWALMWTEEGEMGRGESRERKERGHAVQVVTASGVSE